MAIPDILREAIELGPVHGCELLQARISQVLSEPSEVPVEKYELYYKALGQAYIENEQEFLDGREEVLEQQEMASIDNALYEEMADRLQLPNEEGPWSEMLVDAWDDALESVVTGSWLPE